MDKKSKDNPRTEQIDAILGRLLSQNNFKQPKKLDRLRKRWVKEVGDLLSKHTRLVSLRMGTLRIEVGNSAILHELASFHKPS